MSTELSAAVGTIAADEAFETQETPGAWSQALRRLGKNKAAVTSLVIIGLLYLVAIFAGVIAPYGPNVVHFDAILTPASWQPGGKAAYLLGTDNLGRDLLSRLIYGSRISMTIGLIPVVFYLLIGGTFG